MKINYYAIFNYDEHDKAEKICYLFTLPNVLTATCARNEKAFLIHYDSEKVDTSTIKTFE